MDPFYEFIIYIKANSMQGMGMHFLSIKIILEKSGHYRFLPKMKHLTC